MKNLITLAIFALIFTVYGCEGDEYGTPLVYTICGTEHTFTEDEKTDVTELTVIDLSSSIRTHVASEFPGYEMVSATSFQTNLAGSFIEVIADNGGKLLFNAEGTFICGDDTFSMEGYDDEDEYIDPENLPQTILEYIAQNYPDSTIEKAELEDGEYEVELSNHVELCFDMQGNFIGDDC